MRPLNLLLAVFLICLFSFQPACARPSEDGKLLKVVVLSRHGVRAPTQKPEALALWSKKAWPVWPVHRGDLTPRGEALVKAMWQNLRAVFYQYDLFNEQACPADSEIFIRADVDERTRATARAILDGLVPDCKFGFAALEKDKIDPLFHPVKAGLYHFTPISAATDVLSMTDGGLDNLQADFSSTLLLLDKISGPPSPALCSKFTALPDCQLSDLPNAISVSSTGDAIHIVGGLSIASGMAEIFLLEYGEWPGVAAGWGQVNLATLQQILPIHSKVFDVVNRAPIVAWACGSSLLREMTDALNNRHYDERANKARLVVFVGHDTNIANIGSLLKVNWQAVGYPHNGIPPAGAIFLELWEKDGKKHVIIRFYAQDPQALHAPFVDDGTYNPATPWIIPAGIEQHAPVPGVVTAPPVVGQARFPLNDFNSLVKRATNGAPIAPQASPPFNYEAVIPKTD